MVCDRVQPLRGLGQVAVVCGLVYCLSLFSSSALAGYVPPKKPSAPKDTTSTGVRGNCSSTAIGLTALAPYSHVGQTVSSHPRFAWFIHDTDGYPLQFRLYKIRANNQFEQIYATQLLSQAGIMQTALPPDQPALEVGQRYLWRVIALCNPNHPATAIVTAAELEVVPLPPGFATAAPTAQAAVDRYATAGIWYDALATALENFQPQRPTAVIELLQTLRQIEQRSPAQKPLEQAKRLDQITQRLQP